MPDTVPTLSFLSEDLLVGTQMLTYCVLFPTEKDGGEGEPEESPFPRFQPEWRGVAVRRRSVFCWRGPRFLEDPSGGGEYRPVPLGSGVEDFVPLFDPDTGGGGGNDVLAGPFVPMLILLCLLFPNASSGDKHSSGTALHHLVEVPQSSEEGQP